MRGAKVNNKESTGNGMSSRPNHLSQTASSSKRNTNPHSPRTAKKRVPNKSHSGTFLETGTPVSKNEKSTIIAIQNSSDSNQTKADSHDGFIYVSATKDYQSADPKELDLFRGDIIKVQNGYWGETPDLYGWGEKVSSSSPTLGLGYFPKSHCEILEEGIPISTSSTPEEKESLLKSKNNIDGIPFDHQVPPGTTVRASYGNENRLTCAVYEKQKNDELSLRLGDEIVVKKCEPGGWWLGINVTYCKENNIAAMAGYFPSNYVTMVPDSVKKENPQEQIQNQLQTQQTHERTKSWFRKRLNVAETSGSTNAGEQNDTNSFLSIDIPSTSENNSKIKFNIISENELANDHEEHGPIAPNTGRKSYFQFGNSYASSINTTSPLHGLTPVSAHDLLQELHTASTLPEPELSDLITMPVYNSISDKDKQRLRGVLELILTERDYIRDLLILIEIFMKPMSNIPTFGTKNLLPLFVNIEQIFSVSYKFYLGLKDFLENSIAAGSYTGSIAGCAEIIMLHCEKFMCYIPYLSNKGSRAILAKSEIKSFLKEMIKSTAAGHPDLIVLHRCAEKMDNCVISINNSARVLNGFRPISEIQAKFSEKINLASLTRFTVREDIFHSVLSFETLDLTAKNEIRVYLFNDLLVLARKNWLVDKFTLVEKAPLKDIRVSDVYRDSARTLLIEIRNLSTFYVLAASSVAEKDEWLGAFKALGRSQVKNIEVKDVTFGKAIIDDDPEEDLSISVNHGGESENMYLRKKIEELKGHLAKVEETEIQNANLREQVRLLGIEKSLAISTLALSKSNMKTAKNDPRKKEILDLTLEIESNKRIFETLHSEKEMKIVELMKENESLQSYIDELQVELQNIAMKQSLDFNLISENKENMEIQLKTLRETEILLRNEIQIKDNQVEELLAREKLMGKMEKEVDKLKMSLESQKDAVKLVDVLEKDVLTLLSEKTVFEEKIAVLEQKVLQNLSVIASKDEMLQKKSLLEKEKNAALKKIELLELANKSLVHDLRSTSKNAEIKFSGVVQKLEERNIEVSILNEKIEEFNTCNSLLQDALNINQAETAAERSEYQQQTEILSSKIKEKDSLLRVLEGELSVLKLQQQDAIRAQSRNKIMREVSEAGNSRNTFKLAALIQENETLNSEIKSLSDLKIILGDSVESLKQSLEASNLKSRAATAELEKLRKNAESPSQILSLHTRISELLQAIADLKLKQEEQSLSFAVEKNALESKLLLEEEKIRTYQEKQKRHDEHIASISSKFSSDLYGSNNEKQLYIDKLEAENESKINALQERLAGYEKNAHRQAAVESFQQQLTKELEEYKSRIKQLNQTLKTLDEQNQELRESSRHLGDVYEKAKKNNRDQEETIKSLQASVASLKDTLNHSEEESKDASLDLKEQIRRLQYSFDSAKETTRKLEDASKVANSTTQNIITDLSNQLAASRIAETHLNSNLDSISGQLFSLQLEHQLLVDKSLQSEKHLIQLKQDYEVKFASMVLENQTLIHSIGEMKEKLFLQAHGSSTAADIQLMSDKEKSILIENLGFELNKSQNNIVIMELKLKAEKDSSLASFSRLNTELAVLEKAFKMEKKQHTKSLEDLKVALHTSNLRDRNINFLNDKVAVCSQENQMLSEQAKHKSERISTLESERTDLKHDVQAAKEESARLLEVIRELEQKDISSHQTISAQLRQIKTHERDISEMSSSLSVLKSDYENLQNIERQMTDTFETEKNAFKNTVSEFRLKVDKIENAALESNRALSILQRQYDVVKSDDIKHLADTERLEKKEKALIESLDTKVSAIKALEYEVSVQNGEVLALNNQCLSIKAENLKLRASIGESERNERYMTETLSSNETQIHALEASNVKLISSLSLLKTNHETAQADGLVHFESEKASLKNTIKDLKQKLSAEQEKLDEQTRILAEKEKSLATISEQAKHKSERISTLESERTDLKHDVQAAKEESARLLEVIRELEQKDISSHQTISAQLRQIKTHERDISEMSSSLSVLKSDYENLQNIERQMTDTFETEKNLHIRSIKDLKEKLIQEEAKLQEQLRQANSKASAEKDSIRNVLLHEMESKLKVSESRLMDSIRNRDAELQEARTLLGTEKEQIVKFRSDYRSACTFISQLEDKIKVLESENLAVNQAQADTKDLASAEKNIILSNFTSQLSAKIEIIDVLEQNSKKLKETIDHLKERLKRAQGETSDFNEQLQESREANSKLNKSCEELKDRNQGLYESMEKMRNELSRLVGEHATMKEIQENSKITQQEQTQKIIFLEAEKAEFAARSVRYKISSETAAANAFKLTTLELERNALLKALNETKERLADQSSQANTKMKELQSKLELENNRLRHDMEIMAITKGNALNDLETRSKSLSESLTVTVNRLTAEVASCQRDIHKEKELHAKSILQLKIEEERVGKAEKERYLLGEQLKISESNCKSLAEKIEQSRALQIAEKNAAAENFTNQLLSKSETISTMKNSVAILQNQVLTLSEDLKSSQDVQRLHHESKSVLSSKLAVLEMEKKQLQGALVEIKEANARENIQLLSHQKSLMDMEKAGLNSIIADWKEKTAKLHSFLEEKNQENETLKRQVNEKKDSIRELEILDSKQNQSLKELYGTLSNSKSTRKELENLLLSKSKEFKSMEEQLIKKDKKLEEINNQVAKKSLEIVSLEKSAMAHISKINELQADFSNHSAKIRDLEGQIKAGNEKILELEFKKEKMMKLQADLATVGRLKTDREHMLAAKEKIITELEIKVKHYEIDRVEFSKTTSDYLKNQEKLKGLTVELKENVILSGSLKKMNADLLAQIEQANTKYEKNVAEALNLKGQLKEATANYSTLEGKVLEEKKRIVESLSQKITEKTDIIASLENINIDLKLENAVLLEKLAALKFQASIKLDNENFPVAKDLLKLAKIDTKINPGGNKVIAALSEAAQRLEKDKEEHQNTTNRLHSNQVHMISAIGQKSKRILDFIEQVTTLENSLSKYEGNKFKNAAFAGEIILEDLNKIISKQAKEIECLNLIFIKISQYLHGKQEKAVKLEGKRLDPQLILNIFNSIKKLCEFQSKFKSNIGKEKILEAVIQEKTELEHEYTMLYEKMVTLKGRFLSGTAGVND